MEKNSSTKGIPLMGVWKLIAFEACRGAASRSHSGSYVNLTGGERAESPLMPPIVSGQFNRNVNPADAGRSLKHGPRTHPAHADGR